VNLQTIAAQCPLAGGDAVYQARSLLSLYSSTVYNDKQNCYEIGLNYRTIKPKIDVKTGEQVVKIYPNPTSGLVSITFNSIENGSIIVVDILGRNVFQQVLTEAKNSIKLDLNNLQAGVYFIKIYDNEATLSTHKITIIK
jgi:hypothetical protein